jgi:hypothetical protein
VAAAVALIILAIGCVMRKRRARAFKNAYPVQPNNASTVNYGQEQGIPMQNQQPVPQYQQQPSFQEAPACTFLPFRTSSHSTPSQFPGLFSRAPG